MEDNLLEAGGDIDRVNVTLRVSAPDLDPTWVSRVLGRDATFAAAKGDRRRVRDQTRVQRTGVWLYALPTSPEWELADAIGTLLASFPDDLQVWQQLSSRASAEICCGLHLESWNRGANLPASLVKQLGERSLALDLDIYCDGSSAD